MQLRKKRSQTEKELNLNLIWVMVKYGFKLYLNKIILKF
jgi:hypothetical protein